MSIVSYADGMTTATQSVALRAKVAARKADAEAAALVANAERERRERRMRNAERTIKESPLEDWFPGEEWDQMDYARKGRSTMVDEDGRAVIVADKDRSVLLLLQHDLDKDGCAWAPPRVYLVELRNDSASSSSYYDGPEIKSVEDLGRALIAREKREAEERRRAGGTPFRVPGCGTP